MSVLNSQPQLGIPGRVFDVPLLGPIHITWTRVFIVTVLILAVILLFAPMVTRMMIPSPGIIWDYIAHTGFAKKMYECADCTVAHPVFHWVTTLVYIAPGDIDWPLATIVAGTVFYILTALILWQKFFLTAMKWQRTRKSEVVAAVATLVVMLVGPVTLFTLPDNQYLGYMPMNLYHNPTITALKPFALLLFIFTIAAFTPGFRYKGVRHAVPIILIVCAATLAKPNYTLSLLPAIVIAGVYALARHHKTQWLILFTILSMSGVILLVQLWYMSGAEGVSTGTSIAPFAFFEHYQIKHLLLKFVMSILFPLALYVAYFKKASQDFTFNFAWLVFAFGAFMTYFVAEGAGTDRVRHGNYTWGGQITLFVLFAVAAAFWLKQNYQGGFKFQFNRASLICLGVLGLHLVCGLIFYYYQLFSSQHIY